MYCLALYPIIIITTPYYYYNALLLLLQRPIIIITTSYYFTVSINYIHTLSPDHTCESQKPKLNN